MVWYGACFCMFMKCGSIQSKEKSCIGHCIEKPGKEGGRSGY